MYLMIENSIRGGISTISNRYSQANNPLLEDFKPSEPTTYITYLDANNLYGSAQSEPLPVGDFQISHRRRSFRPRSRLYTRRFTHGLYNTV